MQKPLALAAILIFSLSLSAQNKTPELAGHPQPRFAALTMDGSKIDTAALRGKVVVLNLWFINCPNCVDEIKRLNQLVDEYKGNNEIVFLGLAASRKPDLEKFLVKNPFRYTVIPNSQMIIISKFGTADKNGQILVPFPMHYILDREGKVILKEQGIKGVDMVKAELRKQFSAKIAGSD
jgi:peroxiredoxin